MPQQFVRMTQWYSSFDHPNNCTNVTQFVQGVRDDPIEVLTLQRDDRKWDPEPFTHGAYEVQILFPGTVADVGHFILEPHLEIEGVEVVTLVCQ